MGTQLSVHYMIVFHNKGKSVKWYKLHFSCVLHSVAHTLHQEFISCHGSSSISLFLLFSLPMVSRLTLETLNVPSCDGFYAVLVSFWMRVAFCRDIPTCNVLKGANNIKRNKRSWNKNTGLVSVFWVERKGGVLWRNPEESTCSGTSRSRSLRKPGLRRTSEVLLSLPVNWEERQQWLRQTSLSN